MKKIYILLMAGMIMLGVAGCGQAGENQTAGNQEQAKGQTEEIEAKEPGTQGSGQPASSQENADAQGSSSAESTAPENTGAPVVYMTTDISSDGLMAIYEALGVSPEGNIAVKLNISEELGMPVANWEETQSDRDYNAYPAASTAAPKVLFTV